MMTTRQLQDEILRLKKENDMCILVHAYQNHEILEIADYVGDSFGLSEKAKEAKEKNILMCGVRFMAETVKMLSPDKKVILAHPDADCPMARQYNGEMIRKLKEDNPGYAVVAYINSTADLKAECDACVTSASAVDVVGNIKENNIIFVPDCNLGSFVAAQVPNKNIKLVNGGCPCHGKVTVAEVEKARKSHPKAKLLVHPECKKEVSQCADYVGSTTGIMDYVRKNVYNEYIIGTENSIVEHLQYEFPDKKFYPLSKGLVCADMRLTTLVDVYNCVKGCGGEEIILDEETSACAKKAIDVMLKLG